MTAEQRLMDWLGAFDAIAAAISRSVSERSTNSAIAEAERHGLVKRGPHVAYGTNLWERTEGNTTLRFEWRCFDPSHAYRAFPDRNRLTLNLEQGGQVLRRTEDEYEDAS